MRYLFFILFWLMPTVAFSQVVTEPPVEVQETKTPILGKGTYVEGEYESVGVSAAADEKTVGVLLDGTEWPDDPNVNVFAFILFSLDGKSWTEQCNATFPGGATKVLRFIKCTDMSIKDDRFVKTVIAIIGGEAKTGAEIVTVAEVKK